MHICVCVYAMYIVLANRSVPFPHLQMYYWWIWFVFSHTVTHKQWKRTSIDDLIGWKHKFTNGCVLNAARTLNILSMERTIYLSVTTENALTNGHSMLELDFAACFDLVTAAIHYPNSFSFLARFWCRHFRFLFLVCLFFLSFPFVSMSIRSIIELNLSVHKLFVGGYWYLITTYT